MITVEVDVYDVANEIGDLSTRPPTALEWVFLKAVAKVLPKHRTRPKAKRGKAANEAAAIAALAIVAKTLLGQHPTKPT